MFKKYQSYVLASSLFLLFIFFSYLVHKNLFTSFDFNTTVKLQDHISHRFDLFFSYFSIVGSFEVTTTVLVILLLIKRRLSGIFILVAYGIIHLFELYGKFFVSHHPPPQFMLRTQYPINLPQFYVSTQNSYPSGHAARAMFMTVLILLIVGKSKRVSREAKYVVYGGLFIYDLIMLVSRPYLGEHWTSDVIGGAILGMSLALFIKRWA